MPHDQTHERGGAECQVAAAELVGLDPRAGGGRLDVDHPTSFPDRKAELQRERDSPPRPRAGKLGQYGLKEPLRVGDVIHRTRALELVLVDDLARGGPERVQDRVVRRAVGGHFGVGTLQGLGPDPAE